METRNWYYCILLFFFFMVLRSFNTGIFCLFFFGFGTRISLLSVNSNLPNSHIAGSYVLVRLDTNKLREHRSRVCTLKCTRAVTSCVVRCWLFWVNLKILLACQKDHILWRDHRVPPVEHFMSHPSCKKDHVCQQKTSVSGVCLNRLPVNTRSRPALTSIWTSSITNHVVHLLPGSW